MRSPRDATVRLARDLSAAKPVTGRWIPPSDIQALWHLPSAGHMAQHPSELIRRTCVGASTGRGIRIAGDPCHRLRIDRDFDANVGAVRRQPFAHANVTCDPAGKHRSEPAPVAAAITNRNSSGPTDSNTV